MTKDERKQCTKDTPMPKGDKGRWMHDDTVEIGDDYGSLSDGGSYVRYRCNNCGHEFWVTLPD